MRFCNESYRLWLKRIECEDENMTNVLDWVERVNNRIFMIFDQKYGGPNG